MNKNKSHVTWGGRFENSPSQLMISISESVSFDHVLAKYDIKVSKAHAKMLFKVGIINKKECSNIVAGLDCIIDRIEKNTFHWNKDYEDVHMNIEQALLEITSDASKLHTARSRNDQVATGMRLWFKDAIIEIKKDIKTLIDQLLLMSEKNKNVLIPGYTHLQRAQPVSFAHHILAYVEMFKRDFSRFHNLLNAGNICPLGSGAIAGTTLPIDRDYTAKLLGFIDSNGDSILTQNSMDAISDRDLFIDFANCCATTAMHLSRFSEDFILWSSSEFNFIKLPDNFSTGSSLMPQKKNPDGFELIRGKSARIISNSQSLYILLKGLPLTYNRDLQEDKPPVFDSYKELCLMLKVASATIAEVEINKVKCKESVSDPLLLATDVVDFLVLQDIPFREAHHIVGEMVKLSEKLNVPLSELNYSDVSKIDSRVHKDWNQVFSLDGALNSRRGVGMPSDEQIDKQIQINKTYFNL